MHLCGNIHENTFYRCVISNFKVHSSGIIWNISYAPHSVTSLVFVSLSGTSDVDVLWLFSGKINVISDSRAQG